MDEVVSVAVSIFRRGKGGVPGVAICPTSRDDRARDGERTPRKRAATFCQVGRCEFEPAALKVVPQWPLVYWWSEAFLDSYSSKPKLGDSHRAKQGLITGDDLRYLRFPSEVETSQIGIESTWVPYVPGAAGRAWVEPLASVVRWTSAGLEIRNFERHGRLRSRPQGMQHYGEPGVAFVTIGSEFSARIHMYPSIFSATGASVFGGCQASICALLNSRFAQDVMGALNPTVHFTQGDVDRVPLVVITEAKEILHLVRREFLIRESHREPSVEFKNPGPSPWRHAQEWAQAAVDRPQGAPLPPYEPEHDPESPTDHLSFALGAALGRFRPNGEGILDPAKDDLSHALPAGILFLDGTLDGEDRRDSLGQSAAKPLLEAWAQCGSTIATNRSSLREWLASDFFKDVHKGMYENRPVHWPLSSTNRTFVAWVNIHRFNEQTLRILLADDLIPTSNRLEGELNDLRTAREGANRSAARAAESRYGKVIKARDELQLFISSVEQCADRGAPPADPKTPAREQDARYSPDLDDGVMINSAALWPLLDPQWKDPKKWWTQLSEAKSNRDFDWSHLAMRYWPTRVDEKCRRDPSLGVAHGCFWRYHPERAWAWELRLQDEIGSEFRIEESPYSPGGRDVDDHGGEPHRVTWLRDHAKEALAGVEKEAVRRMRRSRNKPPLAEMRILEGGLWAALPGDVWDMELRLAKKQAADFRLLAPDESESRASYEATHPERVQSRGQFLASLVPPDDVFGEPEEPEGEGADDGETGAEELDVEGES